METWLIIISSLCIPAILKAVFNLLYPSRRPTHNLPPSPFTFPIIESLSWLPKTFADLEPILRDLHPKFGPMVGIGPHPAIFISDRFLIHQALVQNGAVLADRPPALIACRIINSNQRTIDTTVYGLTWRVLRRNLTAEILNHSRVKSYSHGRKLVLQIFKEKLSVKAGEAVLVVNYLRYAMCCLLVLKCFGDKLDESQMKKIKVAQHCVLLNVEVFNLINFWPKVTQILFCKKWKYIFQIHKNQEDLLIPLIKARKKVKKENLSKEKEDKKIEDKEEHIVSYVDTLLDLKLHEEKRKLDEGEMVSSCSEFLNVGTDTTSTALHWITVNLVKYPHVQEKLLKEIKGVVGDGKEEVDEDDL
ncbi:Cytochrome P450 - like 10 [Theobroma cacao]|nr:Cytochrome P450 - like 10 [Theobroma cacao]